MHQFISVNGFEFIQGALYLILTGKYQYGCPPRQYRLGLGCSEEKKILACLDAADS